jgi:hypothetical protein
LSPDAAVRAADQPFAPSSANRSAAFDPLRSIQLIKTRLPDTERDGAIDAARAGEFSGWTCVTGSGA